MEKNYLLTAIVFNPNLSTSEIEANIECIFSVGSNNKLRELHAYDVGIKKFTTPLDHDGTEAVKAGRYVLVLTINSEHNYVNDVTRYCRRVQALHDIYKFDTHTFYSTETYNILTEEDYKSYKKIYEYIRPDDTNTTIVPTYIQYNSTIDFTDVINGKTKFKKEGEL